jgi:hexosaminidase
MRLSALLMLTICLLAAGCGPGPEPLSLIPLPESVEMTRGSFRITDAIRVAVSDADDAELLRLAESLAIPVRQATGWPVPVGGSAASDVGAIHLRLDTAAVPIAKPPDSPLTRDESYALSVTQAGIEIEAATHAGLFYRIQTLHQVLPPELASGAASGATTGESPSGWTVPALKIEDRPRFVYRGLHLDVGRHFFPPEFIKRYIDLMAAYKLNVFHWHLTEDQGWRLEIDRYPSLIEVGRTALRRFWNRTSTPTWATVSRMAASTRKTRCATSWRTRPNGTSR